MDYSYWLRGKAATALFADLEWETPERQDQRGKLAIIGGTKLGFASVASGYNLALQAGAGYVRAVVPDALKPVLGHAIDDVLFTASNKTGAFAKEAVGDISAAAAWADMVLLIGDTGRNSETAICFEQLLQQTDTACIVTRDAVDLLSSSPSLLLERKNTTLVISFAQLQKMLRGVYFPRAITFSMHLSQLVDVLHKVTLSYPAQIVTYHSEQLVIAYDGQVATVSLANPMAIWRGSVATTVAISIMHHPGKTFAAAVAAAHKPV